MDLNTMYPGISGATAEVSRNTAQTGDAAAASVTGKASGEFGVNIIGEPAFWTIAIVGLALVLMHYGE